MEDSRPWWGWVITWLVLGMSLYGPITLQSYKSMIENHLISWLEAKSISALTPDDLDFMIAEMGKAGISATTIRYVLRIMHRVLRDAVKKSKLQRNVADLVDAPPERKPERFEEPKTDRSRRGIPLPINLALLLRQLREQKQAIVEWNGQEFSEDDFIFARPDGSLPDPHYISKVFQRIIKTACLKRIRLHDLATPMLRCSEMLGSLSRPLAGCLVTPAWPLLWIYIAMSCQVCKRRRLLCLIQ